jgi:dolichol kinase
MKEILRQLVHFSGLFFIVFAQLIGKLAASMIFFLIALFFLLYSEHVNRCEKNHSGPLSRIECRLRDFALFFEREDMKKPFRGPFWFYMGFGLAFLIFPLKIATAACAVLAVSDSLSTMIGVRYGRHKLVGRKTLEGTSTFFLSALVVCLLFFNPIASAIAALIAAITELLPESRSISSSRMKVIFDDNLLVPLITGFALIALGMIL